VIEILGLSAFYHDSAAWLLRDGETIAAAREERFTRNRQYGWFAGESIHHSLRTGSICLRDVRHMAPPW
jgi:carbamoyltransferase